jgi:hypothetical protein
MKDGKTRERLRGEVNILCFEMEAAGLMDSFPYLVTGGICGCRNYPFRHTQREKSAVCALATSRPGATNGIQIPTNCS